MKMQTKVKAGSCSAGTLAADRANVWAGPIWNNSEAPAKCDAACSAVGSTFSGEWTTPSETWGKNSVCGCDGQVPSSC